MTGSRNQIVKTGGCLAYVAHLVSHTPYPVSRIPHPVIPQNVWVFFLPSDF